MILYAALKVIGVLVIWTIASIPLACFIGHCLKHSREAAERGYYGSSWMDDERIIE